MRAVEISLRGLPDDMSLAERHKLEALAAVNYCGALGRMLSAVSVEKLVANPMIHYTNTDQLAEELDGAIFVTGELINCLAESAYASIQEMIDAIEDREVESTASGSVNT